MQSIVSRKIDVVKGVSRRLEKDERWWSERLEIPQKVVGFMMVVL